MKGTNDGTTPWDLEFVFFFFCSGLFYSFAIYLYVTKVVSACCDLSINSQRSTQEVPLLDSRALKGINLATRGRHFKRLIYGPGAAHKHASDPAINLISSVEKRSWAYSTMNTAQCPAFTPITKAAEHMWFCKTLQSPFCLSVGLCQCWIGICYIFINDRPHCCCQCDLFISY